MRSTLCTLLPQPGGAACLACKLLGNEGLHQMARRAGRNPSKTDASHLGPAELSELLGSVRAELRDCAADGLLDRAPAEYGVDLPDRPPEQQQEPELVRILLAAYKAGQSWQHVVLQVSHCQGRGTLGCVASGSWDLG